jgi:hypothetical protein
MRKAYPKVWSECMKGRDHSGDVWINGSIILKQILKKAGSEHAGLDSTGLG